MKKRFRRFESAGAPGTCAVLRGVLAGAAARDRAGAARRARLCRVWLESLENRVLLSAAALVDAPGHAVYGQVAQHTFVFPNHSRGVTRNTASPPSGALTPSLMRSAYGVNQISYGAVTGTGAGQTIAIVDAYDYPTAYHDLQTFDAAFGLSDLQLYSASGNTGPYFRRVAQDGSANYPPTDPAGAGNPQGTWEVEEALDIEWAHSIAPQANIILVEAADASYINLLNNAVHWAARAPGVSVLSMSFGGGEFSTEPTFDNEFTTPAGHTPVTFVASTGDTGQPGGYPAFSGNVIGVGGTTLTLNGSAYGSETGWSGSGGSVSTVEFQPPYQNGIVTQSTTKRASPDVAMDADPNSGVAIFDSWDYGDANGWTAVGGTSLAAPMWSGLISIADQLRAANGLSPLDGPTQTLPRLYQLPASDFHDITSGSNGFSAGPGYDLVTGRGSPVANLLVPALASIGAISGTAFEDRNGNAVKDGTDVALANVTVFADANGNGLRDLGTSLNVSSTDIPKSIPDNNTTGITSTLTVSGLITPISDVNVTLHITHPFDGDLTAYLIAPDGATVGLFGRVGSSGANFNNTTFDDAAATSITAGTAPFSGTFRPVGSLAAFNGRAANGIWKLKVVDSARRDTGTLDSWSLNLTTASEASLLTDAAGHYAFNDLTFGNTYTVKQVVPPNYFQDSPANNAGITLAATSNITTASFADFPTVFNTTGNTDSFYVRLDPTHTYLQIYRSNTLLATPTYQIALAGLPGLTFNLLGSANSFTGDFSNGSMIPAGQLSVIAASASVDTLNVIGAGQPATDLTMTDTQIAVTGSPALLFTNFDTLSLTNATVHYSGSFSTLNNLIIGSGTLFIWG